MIVNLFSKNQINKKNIDIISNILLVLVYSLTYINCLYDYNYKLNLQLLSGYIFFDLFFLPMKRMDLIIHHILTLMNIYYAFYYNIDLINNFHLTKQILLLEISSIFYGLKEIVENKSLNKIFQLLFVFFFMKIRIYDYSLNILTDIEIFDSYDKGIIQFYWQYSCIYGLHFLQIYWGCIIIKVMTSGVFKSLPLYKGEYILKYTYVFNLITTILSYYYFLETDEKLLIYGKYAFIDIFGNSLILVSSYYFHNNCNKNLIEYNSNTITIDSKHKNYLMFDISCINIRMLCQIITHTYMHEIQIQEIKNNIYAFIAICILQLASIDTIYYIYIKNCKKKFSDLTSNFLLFLMSIPAIITLLASSNNIFEINTILNTYIYVYFLICLELVEPFYKNTQIFLHLALCLANYKMALNNTYYIRNN
tara:strand:+ start:77 stop:1339 length:1263 start_codon:yes stop_codon:yes gene_type:complete